MAGASAETGSGDGGVRPLAHVLAYRNDLVVHRFCKRLGFSENEAQTVFVELLRWLWYLASTNVTADNPEAHSIDAPLAVIDEMWHDFILVTQNYMTFCDDMFGRYIHHAPARPQDEPPRPEGLSGVKTALAALLGRKRAKYTAIYDILGRDVFVRWYLDYPRRFGADVLSHRQRRTGRDPAIPQHPAEDPLVEDWREKDELIEEALFLNLLPSSADSTGSDENRRDAVIQDEFM